MNGIKVNAVTDLYYDSKRLYDEYVLGPGGTGADYILVLLNQAIEDFKTNWQSQDAVVQINSVISVYNGLVEIRNVLAQLAVDASTVAIQYREIQIANAASLETFTRFTCDPKSKLDVYSYTTDSIVIYDGVNTGKARLENAKNSLDAFATGVNTLFGDILGNWTVDVKGRREPAVEAFGTFETVVENFKQVLADVSTNLTTAINNYGINS